MPEEVLELTHAGPSGVGVLGPHHQTERFVHLRHHFRRAQDAYVRPILFQAVPGAPGRRPPVCRGPPSFCNRAELGYGSVTNLPRNDLTDGVSSRWA